MTTPPEPSNDSKSSRRLVIVAALLVLCGAVSAIAWRVTANRSTSVPVPETQGRVETQNAVAAPAVPNRVIRVLYMEGTMHQHQIFNSRSPGMTADHPMQRWWEHEFLERALKSDPAIDVHVLAKSGDYSVPKGASQLVLGTVKKDFPKTKEALFKYDVIICADIPYNYFSADQINWIVEFVKDHGGGFVMIGGYDSFGEGKYAKTPIDRMLPVEMHEGDDHVDNINIHWHVTETGLNHPIMQLEKDPAKNKEAWSKLPMFHGFARTTRARPAAEVLAEIQEEEYENAFGLAITLAVQSYGNGRTLAFTPDSTGSWGTEWQDTWGREGETGLEERNRYFKTLWINAVRWLAHGRLRSNTNGK